MAHLIKPLEVDGTTYCVIYNGLRTTEIVNTELIGTPTDLATIADPENLWLMDLVGTASEFEVSFAIGCGSSIEFDLSSSTSETDWAAEIEFYVNGVLVDSSSLAGAPGVPDDADSVTLSLTDYPCGNLITVVTNITQPDGMPVGIRIEILSVT